MNKGEKKKVPYTLANIEKCMCSLCPVQADSKCAQDKLTSSKAAMKQMPSGEVPNPFKAVRNSGFENNVIKLVGVHGDTGSHTAVLI